MKICKDCKFFDGADCMKSQDVVTGDTLTARASRNDPNQCGPDGRWFVPIKEDWKEPRDEDGYRSVE